MFITTKKHNAEVEKLKDGYEIRIERMKADKIESLAMMRETIEKLQDKVKELSIQKDEKDINNAKFLSKLSELSDKATRLENDYNAVYADREEIILENERLKKENSWLKAENEALAADDILFK